MKNLKKEYILELAVKHLEWVSYGWHQMSHPELCEYIYKVYTTQLEPLRLEYRARWINKRMHELLTRGYKYAREVCIELDLTWPPEQIYSFHNRLKIVEDKCADIEDDLERITRIFDNLKSDIKFLKDLK